MTVVFKVKVKPEKKRKAYAPREKVVPSKSEYSRKDKKWKKEQEDLDV